MVGGIGEISIAIDAVLSYMNYPTSKQDLVKKAKEMNGSRDLIKSLKNLPEDNFNSHDDVQKAWERERRGL